MTGLSSLKPRICRKYLLNVLQIIENRNCSRELYGKEGLISSYLEATGSIETAVDIHRLLVLSFPGNKIYLPIQKFLNILPSTSSLVISPVISPR
jgi:hypothetical protein